RPLRGLRYQGQLIPGLTPGAKLCRHLRWLVEWPGLWSDIAIMPAEQTLAELVAIDSVSSRSNAEIISYLKRRCEALGFETQTFPHFDESGVEKINLHAFATPKQSKAPFPTRRDSAGALQIDLALVGHTDTVPYDPNWSEALSLTERDGKLFGRGACDTKAFIAAALTTVQNVDLAKLKKPL